MKKNNNVYGVLGVSVRNGNYNAGWDRLPKSNVDGVFKASPYAFQFCQKSLWNKQGERVFGIKYIREDGVVNTLKDRYVQLFEEEDNKDVKYSRVIENLFSCIDIKNFGIAYTGEHNFSAIGVVQISDGMNKYENSNIIIEDILSPFANSNKETAKMTTKGDRIIVDEAHYVHSFIVFPNQYDNFKHIDNSAEYTEEDYLKFKDNSLISVSNYNSKAKAGCKNEFGLFIEAKEEYNFLIDLNGLDEFVKVYKNDDGRLVYDLTDIEKLIQKLEDKIKSIEIYVNPLNIIVKGMENIELTRMFNIITREEI